MNDFSYEAYIAMINALKNTLPLVDFAEIKESDEHFFILRHDVEFSIEKAFELAKIEHEKLGIKTSYFFQIRNYSYNPFSFSNMELIQQIYKMEHKIGLHVNTAGLTSLDNIKQFIEKDVSLLENGLNIPIDRFSYHRPRLELLKLKIKIKGLINTYDDKYFQLYENTIPAEPDIYYLSDSEHQWKYGTPAAFLTKPLKKLQLLIHPYSWSKTGLNNEDNFKELLKLKHKMLLSAMNSECRNFPQELLDDEKI